MKGYMGDRANIVMQSKAGRIYFYTHWNGYDLPSIAQSGLKRGEGRWNDPAYLGRILFSEMIQNDVLDETGYGISLSICDNSYPLLVIDTDSGQVRIEDGPGISSSTKCAVGKTFTFKDFCALNFDNRQPWRAVAGLPDEE